MPRAAEWWDLPLQEETGMCHLSSKHQQALPPRAAGRAEPAWCVCQEQV